MDSRHGGSPPSGLVVPAGLGELTRPDGSMLYEAPVTVERRNAADRAKQFERRRIALSMFEGLVVQEPNETVIEVALKLADELIEKTGGHVTGAASL